MQSWVRLIIIWRMLLSRLENICVRIVCYVLAFPLSFHWLVYVTSWCPFLVPFPHTKFKNKLQLLTLFLDFNKATYLTISIIFEPTTERLFVVKTFSHPLRVLIMTVKSKKKKTCCANCLILLNCGVNAWEFVNYIFLKKVVCGNNENSLSML